MLPCSVRRSGRTAFENPRSRVVASSRSRAARSAQADTVSCGRPGQTCSSMVSRTRGLLYARKARPEAVVSTGSRVPRSKYSTAKPLLRSVQSSTIMSGKWKRNNVIGHCTFGPASRSARRTGSRRSAAASKP